MDDLNLISKNYQETENLLDIIFQFLSINNISINSKKTKLIIINPNKTNPSNSITLNTYNTSIT